MAIQTEFEQNTTILQEDGDVDGAGNATISLDVGEHWPLAHWFGGIDFYAEVARINLVAGTGTAEVKVMPKTSAIPYIIPDGTLDLTTNNLFSFANNPETIELTVSGGPLNTFARLRVSGNGK